MTQPNSHCNNHWKRYFNVENALLFSYFLASIRIALENYDVQPYLKKNVLPNHHIWFTRHPGCQKQIQRI